MLWPGTQPSHTLTVARQMLLYFGVAACWWWVAQMHAYVAHNHVLCSLLPKKMYLIVFILYLLPLLGLEAPQHARGKIGLSAGRGRHGRSRSYMRRTHWDAALRAANPPLASSACARAAADGPEGSTAVLPAGRL